MRKEAKTPPELRVELKKREGELTLLGEPVLRWSVTWPECTGSWRGLERVNRYYRRRAEAWQRRWEREVYPRACIDLASRREEGKPFRVWQAGLATQITWQREEVLSLWQQGEERWGYDRPRLLRTGDTWSLDSGTPRTLASFFRGQRRWKGKLLSQVEEQARRRLESGQSLLDPECIPRLRRQFHPERFYLTGEGVEVFYPLYVLAPGGEGIPVFTIPAETSL